VYDVGGSHISAAVFHQQTCTLQGEVSAGYPSQQSADTFLDVLQSLATSASQGQPGLLGAALAMPGPFDYEAGVSWMQHKLPYLYGFDLRQALATRFSFAPSHVRFLNDAAAYLLGEISAAGAAHGVSRVVGITLGTGVGSGFAVDGHIVRNGPGVPDGGEIWNYPYEGGILEDRISTRAIQAAYKQRTGQVREVAAIAADAGNKDPVAIEVFTEFGVNLGVALHSVLAVFAPQVIVLGGGISRSAQLFLSTAQNQFTRFPAELRVSALGGNAPLVGGGAFWFDAVRATPVASDRSKA
jgi:glucokinase